MWGCSLHTEVFIYFHHGVLVFSQAGVPDFDNVLHESLGQAIGPGIIGTVVWLMLDAYPGKVSLKFMLLLSIERGAWKSMAAEDTVKSYNVVMAVGTLDYLHLGVPGDCVHHHQEMLVVPGGTPVVHCYSLPG